MADPLLQWLDKVIAFSKALIPMAEAIAPLVHVLATELDVIMNPWNYDCRAIALHWYLQQKRKCYGWGGALP